MGVATFSPENYATGKRLGIRPCPRCGDPLGARYSVKDGPKLCWPCSGYKNPAPRAPKPAPVVRLRRRVYSALDAAGIEVVGKPGCIGGLGDPDAGFAGYCPVCRRGIAQVWVLDNPPRVRVDGCSAGCSDDQVLGAL
jgi:hypothetical protein